MSDRNQWLLVAALQPVLLIVCGLLASNGALVFGFITGGATVHALHMAFPEFKEPTDD